MHQTKVLGLLFLRVMGHILLHASTPTVSHSLCDAEYFTCVEFEECCARGCAGESKLLSCTQTVQGSEPRDDQPVNGTCSCVLHRDKRRHTSADEESNTTSHSNPTKCHGMDDCSAFELCCAEACKPSQARISCRSEHPAGSSSNDSRSCDCLDSQPDHDSLANVAQSNKSSITNSPTLSHNERLLARKPFQPVTERSCQGVQDCRGYDQCCREACSPLAGHSFCMTDEEGRRVEKQVCQCTNDLRPLEADTYQFDYENRTSSGGGHNLRHSQNHDLHLVVVLSIVFLLTICVPL